MWKTVDDCFWLASCRACDRCTLSIESNNKAPKKSPCLGSTQIKLLLLARHWTRRNEAISRPKPRASKLSGKKNVAWLFEPAPVSLSTWMNGAGNFGLCRKIQKCHYIQFFNLALAWQRTHDLLIYVHFFSIGADILDNSTIAPPPFCSEFVLLKYRQMSSRSCRMPTDPLKLSY